MKTPTNQSTLVAENERLKSVISSLHNERQELLAVINRTSHSTDIEQLRSVISSLQNERQELIALVEWYKTQFKLYQHSRYGASSEKKVIDSNQLSLFNEAETCADEGTPEPDLEETIIYNRKKRKGKRDETYKDLPIEQRIHELPEDQQICPKCGGDLHVCGHEISRREIEIIPAQVKAVEHVQTIYTCQDCDNNTDSAQATTMVKSQVPAPVIAGSGIASPSLVATVLSNKYVLALPLHRQEEEFKRQGITISKQTMSNWAIYTSARWLTPMYELLYHKLLAYDILHADETTSQVINEPNRKASTHSYLWLYRTGAYAEHKVVLFVYSETRAGKNPLDFLSEFSGFLNVDGYAGYRALEGKGVVLCGCWTHARRKLVDFLKTVYKPERKDSPASIGLGYCNKLFELEQKYTEQGLTPEKRKEFREKESVPVAMALFEWANNMLLSLPPKGKLREAVLYLVNQQTRLMNFRLDGRIEISNNLAERSIRPFAVGRKNWMFAYSPKGATASAVIYSIVETAKANGLVPYKYLEFLFETLPNIPKEQFASCLPWCPEVQERCLHIDKK